MSKQGNIISFQVFIDNKGNLVTEFKHLPIEEVTKVFNKYDTPFVQKIIRDTKPKLEGLHSYLEEELNSLK